MVKSSMYWRGKRILLTGHTGFKGAWLSMWLHRQGAEVHGMALAPPTDPNIYEIAGVARTLTTDNRLDIRDQAAVLATFKKVQPEVVFHLAAQSLVSYSYQQPVENYGVNVMGTAHVLDAARYVDSVRAIVVVTTDKCYENKEWVYPYRENDSLGGFDPYSNSKACTELVAAAYRSSFFAKAGIAIATARAGNVIGGGDWAENRLIPDCVRAFMNQRTLELRYPHAVRPWQHVLEPLSGYLGLAEELLKSEASSFGEAWNFGPEISDTATVGEVASLAANCWGEGVKVTTVQPRHHEAGLLRLDSSKARAKLNWKPRWRLRRALEETMDWYRAYAGGADMNSYSLDQIARYENDHNI